MCHGHAHARAHMGAHARVHTHGVRTEVRGWSVLEKTFRRQRGL